MRLQEAIDYVTGGTKTARTVNKQNAFELSVDGEVFKDWAPGPVSVAGGVAYRKDELRQVVDDPSNPTNDQLFTAVPRNNDALGIRGIPSGFAGVNSGVQFSIVPNFTGEITTKEAFTEVLVPLLKDLPCRQAAQLQRCRAVMPIIRAAAVSGPGRAVSTGS